MGERRDRIQGREVWVQGRLDRDTYYLLRDFAAAHGITVAEATNWAIRKLLINAGIDLRHTRKLSPERSAGSGEGGAQDCAPL